MFGDEGLALALAPALPADDGALVVADALAVKDGADVVDAELDGADEDTDGPDELPDPLELALPLVLEGIWTVTLGNVVEAVSHCWIYAACVSCRFLAVLLRDEGRRFTVH